MRETVPSFRATYDNWDGGQYGHALTFRVPRTIFPELIGRTEELSERLRDLLNEINPVQNEFVAKVFFEIEPGKGEGWRAASGALLPRDHAGDVMLRASAGAWATEQCRLFISHVSASKAVAHALKRDFHEPQQVIEFGLVTCSYSGRPNRCSVAGA